MITECKICKFKIPELEIPVFGRNWVCICKSYSINLLPNGYTELETLTVGNYHLIFMTAYKEASVVERLAGTSHKRINSIPMDELTPELAKHWIKKLKTYVLFQ